MRIDKLRIKNFKGFEEETFLLNPHFTVFIGDNAKGKTSVLDALAVAAGSFLRGIDVAKLESRSIDKNEIRVVTKDGQPLPQLPVEIHVFGNVNGKSLDEGWLRTVDKISPKKTNTTYVKAKNIEKVAEDMLKLSRSGNNVIFPVIAYHGTGRLWAVHEKLNYQKQEEGVVMAYTNALSAKVSPKEFLEWYKTQEDEVKKFEQPLQISLLKAFKKVVTSIIPDNRWQDIAFDNKENELAGIFTTEEGKKEKLKFTQLSDGYRNIVALAADIAFRAIQLNPHLGEEAVVKTPGIVLIDEIDMHLHPNWQKRIVDDLKNTFPNIQFIATTHSPFIVQSLKSDEIWNLDKLMDVAPDELKIDTIATEIMGVSSPYSESNEGLYNKSKKFMEDLESNKSVDELQKELDDISDPAVRAFLELQKISKGK